MFQDLLRDGRTSSELRVSVVVTSCNQEAYLGEAIESVLAQTRPASEILLVDDGSSDASREIVERYARAHPGLVRTLCHERTLGYARAKRAAVELCSGDLVTWLDGDDRLLPRKLELEIAALEADPEASLAYSNTVYIDARGAATGVRARGTTRQPSGDVFLQMFGRAFPDDSEFRNELVVARRLREVELYDASFPLYVDWDVRIRLTKRLRVAYCPEALVEYRLHDASLTARLPVSVRLQALKAVYEKNRPLLDDLPEADREFVRRRLAALCARLARSAAREAWSRGDWPLATARWLEACWRRVGTGEGFRDVR